MKNFIFSVIAFLLLCLFQAQSYEFRILAANGETSIRKNSRGKWISISVGDELFTKDEVRLGRNSYLGLIHNTGKTKEIKKAGTFKVSDLSKGIKRSGTSLTKRFTDYVLNEMSDADNLMSYSDYHERMSTTGSVERAIGDDVGLLETLGAAGGSSREEMAYLQEADKMMFGSGSIISVKYPKTSYFFGDQLKLVWYALPGKIKYTVRIRDEKNKLLFEQNTTDTSLVVDADSSGLVSGRNYYWQVVSGDIASFEYSVSRMSKTVFPDFYSKIEVMEKEFDTHSSALNNIIMASFYSENNIMQDAIECYERAIKLAPGSEEYKKLFAIYLNSEGLTDEAIKVYSKVN